MYCLMMKRYYWNQFSNWKWILESCCFLCNCSCFWWITRSKRKRKYFFPSSCHMKMSDLLKVGIHRCIQESDSFSSSADWLFGFLWRERCISIVVGNICEWSPICNSQSGNGFYCYGEVRMNVLHQGKGLLFQEIASWVF